MRRPQQGMTWRAKALSTHPAADERARARAKPALFFSMCTGHEQPQASCGFIMWVMEISVVMPAKLLGPRAVLPGLPRVQQWVAAVVPQNLAPFCTLSTQPSGSSVSREPQSHRALASHNTRRVWSSIGSGAS
jgi:hypothetical protein